MTPTAKTFDAFDSLPLDAKQRIDAACDRFERAWRDSRPDVAAFVALVPETERAALLTELLHIERERRTRLGESVSPEEYIRRLPDYMGLVLDVLGDAQPDSSVAASMETAAGGPSATHSTTRMTPPAVPGYEVLGELGRGGMGVVFRARHLPLNRLVALKFMRETARGPIDLRDRFRREAEVIAALRHPNIVSIYDIGEAGGQCYLALELAECGSLRDRLKGNPVEPFAAVGVIEPIVRAVQHAHRHGVVHRDIKPANILLTPGGDSVAATNLRLPETSWAGRLDLPVDPSSMVPLTACYPKLTDFGLAALIGTSPELDEPGTVGTPAYMAPEQIGGSAEAGPAADIWSIGATLYEMLTGRPPFVAKTINETLQLVLMKDPAAPRSVVPTIPRFLEAVCMRCLSKKPADRYPGPRELAQELRRFLDGDEVDAPESFFGKLLGWFRRKPG